MPGHYARRLFRSTVISLMLLCLFVEYTLAGVEYQNRGNRYEGVNPKPVAGYNIELISVLADYREEVEQKTPVQFRLKFYLHETPKVYLTVRELDYKHYYWMDKLTPRGGRWKPGAYNNFEWSTQDVILQLDGLKMYDLGAVARLERPEPARIERVAPVIFYHSELPATIERYRFTLKTYGDARLICSIYKEGEAEAVFTRNFPRQRGGRPFTVPWDGTKRNGTKAAEGAYKLVIGGYFLGTNDPAVH